MDLRQIWGRFSFGPSQISQFKGTVPVLRGEAIKVAMNAATTAAAIESSARLSEDQAALASTIEHSSTETTAAVDHVSDNAQRIAASTEESLRRARCTADDLRLAAQRITSVDDSVKSFLGAVQQVSERCEEVAQVIEQISRISRQTKILSLNAAIEAARAGQSGRGFAVVAQAIRTLAEEVSEVTQKSRESVALATSLSAEAAGRSTAVRKDIQFILQAVSSGSGACDLILSDLEGASSQFTQIAAAAEQMAAANMHVRASIVESKRMSTEVANRLRSTTTASNDLLASTENIQELLAAFNVGNGSFEQLLRKCRAWRDRIQRGVQEVADSGQQVFSTDYVPIHNTNPQQHRVSYQPEFERRLRPVLDKAKADTRALACVCTDERGYLPTHNSEFCCPPSGDPAVDIKLCRDKRIMKDRYGQRSAQYGGQLLLQTFVRDNGDLTVEIALPIRIRGRKWGAVRFGFAPGVVTSEG